MQENRTLHHYKDGIDTKMYLKTALEFALHRLLYTMRAGGCNPHGVSPDVHPRICIVQHTSSKNAALSQLAAPTPRMHGGGGGALQRPSACGWACHFRRRTAGAALAVAGQLCCGDGVGGVERAGLFM